MLRAKGRYLLQTILSPSSCRLLLNALNGPDSGKCPDYTQTRTCYTCFAPALLRGSCLVPVEIHHRRGARNKR